MKKYYKIIVLIIFFLIYFVSVFYLLPQVSSHYFYSDISDFENSALVLIFSIIISIVLVLLIVLDMSQFKLNLWGKISHILYLGIMSYLFFMMIQYTITPIGLAINKTNQSSTFSKEFKISHKDKYEGDNQYVYGRYLENINQAKMDRLFVGKEHYSKLKKHIVITVNLKKGVLSIPFDPKIVE